MQSFKVSRKDAKEAQRPQSYRYKSFRDGIMVVFKIDPLIEFRRNGINPSIHNVVPTGLLNFVSFIFYHNGVPPGLNLFIKSISPARHIMFTTKSLGGSRTCGIAV